MVWTFAFFDRSARRLVCIGLGVVKLDGPAFERDPPDERLLVHAEGPRLDVLAEFAGEAVARGGIIETVADKPDGRLVGMAEPARRLHQRVEHGLQIERRAADDLEHVCSGGLLLQRFARLVEQPGVLDGDDSLRREVSD
jgi:hypothetical protein